MPNICKFCGVVHTNPILNLNCPSTSTDPEKKEPQVEDDGEITVYESSLGYFPFKD